MDELYEWTFKTWQTLKNSISETILPEEAALEMLHAFDFSNARDSYLDTYRWIPTRVPWESNIWQNSSL